MDEYEFKTFNLSTGGGMSVDNLAFQLSGSLEMLNRDFSAPSGLEAGSYTVTRSCTLEIIDLDTSETFVQNRCTSSRFVVPGDSTRTGFEGTNDLAPRTVQANWNGGGRDVIANVPPPKRLVSQEGTYGGVVGTSLPEAAIVPITAQTPGNRSPQSPPGIDSPEVPKIPPRSIPNTPVKPSKPAQTTNGAVYEPPSSGAPFVSMTETRDELSALGARYIQIIDDTQPNLQLAPFGSKNGSVRVNVSRQSNVVRLPDGRPALPTPPLQQKFPSVPDASLSMERAFPTDTGNGAALSPSVQSTPSPPAKSSHLPGATEKPPSQMKLTTPPPLKILKDPLGQPESQT